jgi:hypothetical protein
VPGVLVEELALEPGEERLGHGIVVAVSDGPIEPSRPPVRRRLPNSHDV